MLQRLTSRGEPVDFDDPQVASDNHGFRILAVWAVPRSVRRIKLSYWHMPLSEAITIVDRDDGPRVIDQTPAVVGYSVQEPIDISVCSRCGGPMRIIRAVTDPDAIEAELHGARAPPRPPPPGQMKLFTPT